MGVGAVVLQNDEAGLPRPIQFASRKMTEAESRYATREQEALAIVWGIEEFDDFVRGRTFVVATDHRSLQWLMTAPQLKSRLMNWAYKLSQYDFLFVGNVLADVLSRLVHWSTTWMPEKG